MRTTIVFFLLLTSIGFSQSDTILFSHQSGYYSKPFVLKISNTSGNKIYYSLDGNYPKTEFKDFVLISSTLSMRVKNEGETKGYTRNFLFKKHQLPVVFLTLKPSDLFDSISGMYVKGPGAKPEPPYHGANFHKNWERMADIELLDTANVSEFNQKVGIRIFGQYSAMLPQKSFSIHAKKKYGEKKIKAKVFPELEFKKYKSFILRNSGSDFCNSHFRDVLMTGLVRNWNIETQASRSCVVYLNGKYWGVYHLREKLNEHYLQQHFEVEKDNVAILKHRGDVQQYGRMNYNSMLKFIERSDFSKNENIDSLSKLMDIDNYLDYNIAQLYCNNIDAGGNIRYWRSREAGSKWRWMLFDTDFGFGLSKSQSYQANTVEDYFIKSNRKWPYPNWSTVIIRKLLENEAVKQTYLRKITNYLNDELSENTVKSEVNRLKKILEPEMSAHFGRWNRPFKTWNNSLEKITEFAENRPTYLRNYLKDFFEIDTVFTLSIDKIENGSCILNDIKHDSAWSGIFFSNLSYTLKAIPDFGYHFTNWKQDTNNRLTNISVVLHTDKNVTPIFLKNGLSEYSGKVLINEICKKDSVFGSYIELRNTTNQDIDISGWHIVNNKKTHFVVPNGISLSKQGFISFYQNNASEDDVSGLFNVTSNDSLFVYSGAQELVDKVGISKSMFKKANVLERVDAVIRKGWFAVDSGTPNGKNGKQTKSEKENKYILIGFVVGIVLLILSLVILLIKNRPRGATE